MIFVSPVSSLLSHIIAMPKSPLGGCCSYGVIRPQQPGGLKKTLGCHEGWKKPSLSWRPKTKQAAWFHVKVVLQNTSQKTHQISVPKTRSNQAPGLVFKTGEQALKGTALLAEVLFPSTSRVMSPMQKAYGWFICLFFQNANHQNNTFEAPFPPDMSKNYQKLSGCY